MSRNDKLYEESRIIRKLVNQGKTTKEIMEQLSLTTQQIKYRVTTRYSKGIAEGIIKKLADNDKEDSEKFEVIQENKNKSKALVIDTSALGKKGSAEFIIRWPKVIILVDVLKELEKRKTVRTILGKNIRKLLAVSAKDVESKQFEIVLTEKTSSYVDNTILDYCKGKDVVLYTADNALANMAKGYGIEYIRAKEIRKKRQEIEEQEIVIQDLTSEGLNVEATSDIIPVEEVKNEEVKEEVINIDVEEIIQNMQANTIKENKNDIGNATINNVEMLGKNLTLIIPNTLRIAYAVLRENVLKKPAVGTNYIKLEVGDLILIMTYKFKHHGLCIARYEITGIKPEEHSMYLGSQKVSKEKDLEKLNFPKDAIREVRNYYALVRKK